MNDNHSKIHEAAYHKPFSLLRLPYKHPLLPLLLLHVVQLKPVVLLQLPAVPDCTGSLLLYIPIQCQTPC